MGIRDGQTLVNYKDEKLHWTENDVSEVSKSWKILFTDKYMEMGPLKKLKIQYDITWNWFNSYFRSQLNSIPFVDAQKILRDLSISLFTDGKCSFTEDAIFTAAYISGGDTGEIVGDSVVSGASIGLNLNNWMKYGIIALGIVLAPTLIPVIGKGVKSLGNEFNKMNKEGEEN